jgi:GT2 family glycosyltransferase
VDNRSRDDTVAWLRREHPGVHLIANTENRGFAAASNQGIRAARGEYVLLLNPDTVAGTESLARTVAYLERNPRLAVATCKVLRPDGRLDPSCKRQFPSLWDAFVRFVGLSRVFPRVRLFTRYDAHHLDEDTCQEVPLVDGCYMMMRRSALDDIGLLDERFFMYVEEMDWCRRAHEHGWTVGYDPSGTIVHHKGEITRHATFRMLYHFHRSMALYCCKYRRWWNPTLVPALLGIGVRCAGLLALNALRTERRVSG